MKSVVFSKYQLQPAVYIPQSNAGALFAGCGRNMVFLVQGLVKLLQCGGIHALSIVGYAYTMGCRVSFGSIASIMLSQESGRLIFRKIHSRALYRKWGLIWFWSVRSSAFFFLSTVYLAVILWRNAHVFFEQLAEVTRILKAYRLSNLIDRQVGVLELGFSMFYPV